MTARSPQDTFALLREVELREHVRVALAYADGAGNLTVVAVPGKDSVPVKAAQRQVSYPGLQPVRLEVGEQFLDRHLFGARHDNQANITERLVMAADPVVQFCHSDGGRNRLHAAHIDSMLRETQQLSQDAVGLARAGSVKEAAEKLSGFRSSLGSAAEAAAAMGDEALMDRLAGTRLPELSDGADQATAVEVASYYLWAGNELAKCAPAAEQRAKNRDYAQARFQLARGLGEEARQPAGLPSVDFANVTEPITRQGLDATLYSPPPRSELFYTLWQQAMSETPELMPNEAQSQRAAPESDLEMEM